MLIVEASFETNLKTLLSPHFCTSLVGGKELHPLSHAQLAGFRLHPGPLPEEYRGLAMVHSRQRRHKAKKHKYR